VAVVTRPAGLTDVLALSLGIGADRLAVSHLRLANVRLDLVLAHHAVNDDLEVKLPHAGDDRLTRIRIGVNAEGRILLRQLGQSHAHLLLVRLRLRLHGDEDYEGTNIRIHPVLSHCSTAQQEYPRSLLALSGVQRWALDAEPLGGRGSDALGEEPRKERWRWYIQRR
jgi:hypothetical protein